MMPREAKVTQLGEENMKIPPQRYSITSKNTKAMRVVHDFYGTPVAINPGETKPDVWLQPRMAVVLARGDLDVVSA